MPQPRREAHTAIAAAVREARARRQLTQADVARALGIGQRQVSDLERGVIDPRLSTVQNIARYLDLELTLVPRSLITTVEGLLHSGSTARDARAVYALDEEPVGRGQDESEPTPRGRAKR